MRKIINIITLLVIAGCSSTVLSGPAVIYNGAYVKALKDQFKLNNTANIMTGTDDPSSVANDAPKGSIYLRQGAVGELFIKQDAGSSTNWSKAPVTLASLTASRALQSDASGNIESSAVTNTELGYVSGVTSAIQTQLDTLQTSDIFTPLLGSPTYDTLKEYIETGFSAGFIYPEHTDIFTDNGDGTVNIAATRAILKTSDNHIGPQVSIDVAAVTNLAMTDLAMNYVVLEYNAGTPQITVSVVNTNDKHSIINVANIYRDGTRLHINEAVRMDIGGFQDHTWNRFLADGFAQAYGGLISETGTRNIAVTAGRFWYGIDHFDTSLFDSSAADTFTYWHRDGVGGWTSTLSSTQISNTLYDDNSGTLATLANSKYGVHWIFMETDGDIQTIYGRGSYALDDANSAEPPSDLPPSLGDESGFIVGKIIVGKNDTAFTSTLSTFGTVFTGATTTDHQTLTGLQGGTANEYYHTTAAEHTIITQPASTTLSGYLTTGDWNTFDDKLANLVEDSTPQLGGNLDVNGQNIGSSSSGNITVGPNGTGELRFNVTSQGVPGSPWISENLLGSGVWGRPVTGEKNYIADNPSGLFDTYGWTESTSGQVDISATETASEVPREETTGTGLKIVGTGTTASEYAAFAFTIDDADVSKKLKISFSKKDLATYVAGEFEVVIIEDPTGTPVEITPATSAIPAGTGEFLTSFDTTATLSYEIRFRRPTGTSAASAGFVISDLIVGPGKIVQGFAGWAQYYDSNTTAGGTVAITVSGATLSSVARGSFTPYKTQNGVWRLNFNIVGTLSSSDLNYQLIIDGVSFESTTGNYQVVTNHTGSISSAGNTNTVPATGELAVRLEVATTVVRFSGDVELDSMPTWATDNSTLNQISDDVVAANARFSYSHATAVTIATGTNIIKWSVPIIDSTNYDVVTGGYTIPATGDYEIVSTARIDSVVHDVIGKIKVDGVSLHDSTSMVGAARTTVSMSRVLSLTKGEVVTIDMFNNSGSSTSMSLADEYNQFSVTRLADYTAGSAVGFGLASATESGLVKKNKWAVHYITADTNSTGASSDLNFSNLVPGNWYRLKLKLNIDKDAADSSAGVTGTHDSAVIINVNAAAASASAVPTSNETRSDVIIFKATAATVTFADSSVSGTTYFRGNNTTAESHAILEELANYDDETTDFD